MALEKQKESYVDKAENVIKELGGTNKGKNLPTSTQMRNLLSLTMDIYNTVMICPDQELPREIRDRIDYLRLRLFYESGRDDKVRALVDKARLVDKLASASAEKKQFINFCHYMEALVAFRKFYFPD